ncbi:MAG: hypothetical protein WDM76_16455 [Limisphaerales bacterium]
MPNGGMTSYYKVSAVNTNGESSNSLEGVCDSAGVGRLVQGRRDHGFGQRRTCGNLNDSSGHGFTALQTILSQRPAYVANALNGLPVVRF